MGFISNVSSSNSSKNKKKFKFNSSPFETFHPSIAQRISAWIARTHPRMLAHQAHYLHLVVQKDETFENIASALTMTTSNNNNNNNGQKTNSIIASHNKS